MASAVGANDMPRTSIGIGILFLVGAVLCVIAHFTEGYWQATLIGVATVFFTLAATEALNNYRDQFVRPIFYVTLLTIGLAALIGTTLYLTYRLINMTRVPSYPAFAKGMIADFNGGTGSKPHTVFGTECAIISDSSHNLDSHLTYKLLDPDHNGEGHLELSFHLESNSDDTPFTGIFCSFSFFPEVPYDVSYFHKLSFRIRSVETHPSYVVRAVLYSGTPSYQGRSYAMPSYEVTPGELSSSWDNPLVVHFDDFHPAKFFRSDARFDPHHAYRIGFVVVGKPGSTADGKIDVDDIAFRRDFAPVLGIGNRTIRRI